MDSDGLWFHVFFVHPTKVRIVPRLHFETWVGG